MMVFVHAFAKNFQRFQIVRIFLHTKTIRKVQTAVTELPNAVDDVHVASFFQVLQQIDGLEA